MTPERLQAIKECKIILEPCVLFELIAEVECLTQELTELKKLYIRLKKFTNLLIENKYNKLTTEDFEWFHTINNK